MSLNVPDIPVVTTRQRRKSMLHLKDGTSQQGEDSGNGKGANTVGKGNNQGQVVEGRREYFQRPVVYVIGTQSKSKSQQLQGFKR